MIKFNSDVKIIAIDSSYTEDEDFILSLYFNTKHTIISSKSVLDVVYMFNGFFNATDISSTNLGHKDIESGKIVNAVLDYGIVSDLAVTQFDAESQELFSIAQNKLREYTVHFPQISNINVMIAVILQKLCVKCVFYNDSIISADDVSQNIYYRHSDIGRSVSSVLKEEIGALGINFQSSVLNEDVLNGSKDILVNSDFLNWVDSEKCIVINTWNYANAQFKKSGLFNNNKLDISDDLKPLIKGYILAIRSIDDMVYSIKDGTVS